jgi:hypothetical protein
MFKVQSSLDNFFSNSSSKDKKYHIKRYFYLLWEDKFKPKCQAYWTDKKPEKINFMEQVNCDYIKKGYYFYICGYFSDYDDKSYYLTKEKVYKNVHYLKSHLQKCIRKQNDALAIPTSYHLFKLSLNDLLRRLPVIMIEDTTLHESFTTLIWLMIANSNGKFKMKQYIYEWILGVVYVLCKIDEKDKIISYESKNTKNNIDILDGYSLYDEKECSILYSMHMRIAYGGLEVDLGMFREYISVWEERFSNKSKSVNNMDIKPISIYVREMILADWDISAIDHHCNGKFIDYIAKKYDEIDREELKNIIWHHSSSCNNREPESNYNKKQWSEIKAHVLKTQKYLLDSSY